jgi:hypothetical protein
MKTNRRHLYLCLAAITCTSLLLAGCSKKTKTRNVSGKVTIDGKPLARGKINIISADGKTNKQGEIKDGEYEVKGAPSGDVKVTVQTKYLKEGGEMIQIQNEIAALKQTINQTKQFPKDVKPPSDWEEGVGKKKDELAEREKKLAELKEDQKKFTPIPDKYEKPEQTPLSKKVDGDTLDIELESK